MGHGSGLLGRAEPTQRPPDSSGFLSPPGSRGQPCLGARRCLESQRAGGLADRGGVCRIPSQGAGGDASSSTRHAVHLPGR